MARDEDTSKRYGDLQDEVARLRAENQALIRRTARLEDLLVEQRAVLFEMDVKQPNAVRDVVLIAGSRTPAVPRIAEEVAERVKQERWADAFELDVQVPDPQGAPSSWHAKVTQGGSNGWVIVAARDVTLSSAHLEHLEEKESLYHSLLELLPEPVLFTDLSGHLLYINPAGVALVGADRPDELVGRSIWPHLHPEDVPQMRDRARRLVHEGTVEEAELRFVRRDQSLIYVEAHSVATRYEGRPAVLTTARDVTDRRLAASAIRDSRETLAKIFQLSPAAIALIRRSDGHILEVNAAWTELTGRERSASVQHTLADVLPAPDRSLIQALIQRMRGEEQASGVEFVLEPATGGQRAVLCSWQQIRMGGERTLLAVFSDITSRKQMEDQLIEARDRAHEMAQIRTSFLTNMTHEIRTPLTVILGFTSMLKQGVNPAYRRFVNVIERSGKRLLLTLDSILDLAQLEAGTVQVDPLPFRVDDAIESVIGAVEPLARDKGLSVTFDRLEQPVFVAGGHKLFTRIIHHLLDNAVKFTEAGAIQVRVDVDEEVSVRVSDTGIGIRSEFLPHLFEEFSQESTGLERTHQGSGLGLAVSRRLAEAMGGRIEVESEKGRGSTFRLVLPEGLPRSS